jgi:hypothetical protein
MVSNAVKKKIAKNVKAYDELMMISYRQDLEDRYIPQIKESIMAEYDTELVAAVTDRRSRTNPLLYREEFEDLLDSFEYIIEADHHTTLVVPDMENFPWGTGRMRVVENILDGTAGVYVEVDESQYVQLYGRQPRALKPYDKTVPRAQRIYLLKYTPEVQRLEMEVFHRRSLVRYPFSNTPSIDIFDQANTLVERNLKSWISESIKDISKEYVKKEPR